MFKKLLHPTIPKPDRRDEIRRAVSDAMKAGVDLRTLAAELESRAESLRFTFATSAPHWQSLT